MTASFFDTLVSASDDAKPQASQDSTTSSASLVFESAATDSPCSPKQQQQHNKNNKIGERPKLPVYEDYLPDWQALKKTYASQKDVLHQQMISQLQKLRDLEERFDKMSGDFHSKVENAYLRLSDELTEWQTSLDVEKSKYEKEKELMREVRKIQDEKVKLNVGGQLFETSLTTLRRDPNSMLAAMFNGHRTTKPDADGSYFIDRDSTYFRLVLNYLRDMRIPPNVRNNPKIMDELIQEARFYKISGLLKLRWLDLPKVTQDQLWKLYPIQKEQQAVTMLLQNKDLSGLDFSNYRIDPRSRFDGSNLENAHFEHAWFVFDFDHKVDFINTYMMGARFPAAGTPQRAPGVQFKLEGAITNDPLIEN
ncbi:BTB (POZ) domain-containing protein [Apophysomyces ossiformis]|uniref:BTB (POZ) domain-containing protein n=1 Tax=Apophysomyces ossiformis TaxID=679940 RepID=A0A8H7BU51_9FUNG|nr:BTB (POZ) domain-containing protein [Apophysomyces ossiformis]